MEVELVTADGHEMVCLNPEEDVHTAIARRLSLDMERLSITCCEAEILPGSTLEENDIEEGARLTVRSCGLRLEYASDFDTNGVLYYIGSTGCKVPSEEWVNPVMLGEVTVDISSAGMGTKEDFVGREQAVYFRTADVPPPSWISLRLERWQLIPSKYTLRNTRDDNLDEYVLRNWILQGKVDDDAPWIDIRVHEDDDSLSSEKYSTASWDLDSSTAFQTFRVVIKENSPNHSRSRNYLHAAIELYGTLSPLGPI